MQAARGTTRDAERTRQKILTRASAEFAAKGFDGARVDAIAARCRLSKNMLYYYFGSKEGLFLAVLESTYERLRARQADFTVSAQDPVEAMRRLVRHTFDAVFDHPEAIRLLNDENLHKARHIKRSKRIRELYDPLVQSLTQVLRDGVTQGLFRESIDPLFLYMSLSSLAYHYLSNQYTLELALDMPLSTESARAHWLEHITEMVLRFCQREAASVSDGWSWLKKAS
jgi:TetR/AcrR family transcriptional regulator